MPWKLQKDTVLSGKKGIKARPTSKKRAAAIDNALKTDSSMKNRFCTKKTLPTGL